MEGLLGFQKVLHLRMSISDWRMLPGSGATCEADQKKTSIFQNQVPTQKRSKLQSVVTIFQILTIAAAAAPRLAKKCCQFLLRCCFKYPRKWQKMHFDLPLFHSIHHLRPISGFVFKNFKLQISLYLLNSN